MQRVRQILPFLRHYGWEAEVVAVQPRYIDAYSVDPLLSGTIPPDIRIHFVKAFSSKFTRKFGLGSLSIRCFWQLRSGVNRILKKKQFDLIFFSTTAFHVLALGPYWKLRFGVPFIVDMQDPWRSDFYLDKPKSERPPKFLINYHIDRILERRTIPNAAGIVSVSKGYCAMLQERYGSLRNEDCKVIPFGAVPQDFEFIKGQTFEFDALKSYNSTQKNIVYVGRGGHDLKFALGSFFMALRKGIVEEPELFGNVKCWFIGTSYAPKGEGTKTIEPLATEYGVQHHVTEIPDRLPYFHTLSLLTEATMLFVPGSVDANYTASKIYPYILARKPLLAIFNNNSSVLDVLKETKAGIGLAFDNTTDQQQLANETYASLVSLLRYPSTPHTDWSIFAKYTAQAQSKELVTFFETVLAKKNSKA